VNDNAVAGTVAWSTRPVWSVVSEHNHIISGPLQLHFAQQMHSTVVPVPAGHLVMIQEPQAVANAIIAATNGS
jgi:pimeloyl-ACP methyl ester carboxylesterase